MFRSNNMQKEPFIDAIQAHATWLSLREAYFI